MAGDCARAADAFVECAEHGYACDFETQRSNGGVQDTDDGGNEVFLPGGFDDALDQTDVAAHEQQLLAAVPGV